ncbi:phosphoenolpyruvate carboxykinase (ATP) [Staphylococcus aureus]
MLKLTVINELAWHNLFAKNMFIRPESKEEATKIKPNFTIVSAPHFKADPEVDGTKSETFVIISFKHKVILIGGTEYAGGMEKRYLLCNELSLTDARYYEHALLSKRW